MSGDALGGAAFRQRLAACAAAASAHLGESLAALPASGVRDAMAHATTGGKRLRAFLVMEGATLHGVADEASVAAAAAIEAMHAYSLVHDDLPAMDDDDLRRGRPTVHRAWDEATAILAGDALQSLAFELALLHPEPDIARDLALSLARAAGAGGMVLGQAQDLAAESGERLSLAEVEAMQAGKTGALIRWSAEAGARLARADLRPLSTWADALGLAFQIADDLLDATGDTVRAGKAVGKDADRGKATFVGLLGVDGARARAAALVETANAALAPYGARADTLREAARFAISRDV
jgi:farnesyl diphosphate synthase